MTSGATRQMSAIYSRRWKRGALANASVDDCEKRGAYFCYSLSLKAAVAVLNFREHVFVMRLSKVSQDDEAPSHRTYSPPQILSTLIWDSDARAWLDETLPVESDATSEMLAADLELDSFAHLLDRPRLFERFAALSLGYIGLAEDVRNTIWPSIEAVDANCIDAGETILRTTFAQDPRADAKCFRRNRYLELQRFNEIRKSDALPRRMNPFSKHSVMFEFELPYSNLRAPDGRPATAIYFQRGSEADVNVLYTRVLKHLALAQAQEVDKDHVVIWYLGQLTKTGVQLLVYPLDATPHVTDDPTLTANSISSSPP